MKKRILLSIFICTFIFMGCKKEKPVRVVKEVLPKMEVKDYAIRLVESSEVLSLSGDKLLIRFIDTNDVNTSELIATIGVMKDYCSYSYLDLVYKQIPGKNFISVWIAPESGSHLVIERRSDLESNYDWYEKFKILGPKIFWVQIGNQVFYLKNGKIIGTN